MDIFNRQPSIAEDTIQYSIYPIPGNPDKASIMALAACITDSVDSALSDFIWHRDAFEVKVVSNPDNAGSWILEGRMRVGDCIDDEWCIVWLLKELSSKWQVVVSVYDSDGEFLLIEAAQALPSWVKPSNSENRVWIYQAQLHLLPLVHVSPNSKQHHRRRLSPGSDDESLENEEHDEFIATIDALKLVIDPQCDTLAPPAVEKLVWDRIAGYPSTLKNHVHTTKAYIPQDIMKALLKNPPLLQKAVEAFYTRDAIQLRAAHRMSRFPPNTAVLASVRMTRTAYAQLSGQKFYPPKIFGQWKEPEGSSVWRDTGMKIAIGFEILYQESKNRHSTQNLSAEGMKSSTEATRDTLQRDPEYQKYIKNLVSANYFKGELQGSELWNELEIRATLAFVQIRRNDDISRPSFASQVDAAVASVKELSEQIDQGEDSEEWLNIDAENFDQMLENALTKGKSKVRQDANAMDVDREEVTESAEDDLASEQAKRLKDLANKVENFIEGEGDIEGAVFEDEEFSDEPFSDGESSGNDSELELISSDKRASEQQLAMDNLVPALEPSEYGKMPSSYHDNSQRVASTTILTDNADEEHNPGPSDTDAKDTRLKTKLVRPPILPRDKYDGVDSDDESDVDSEEEEEHPQVVGEIEIDMQEEAEEFIEFSKQALGISDVQWAEIVKDRQERGVFLPPTETSRLPRVDKIEKSTPQINETTQASGNPNLNSFESVMKALDEVLSQTQRPMAKSSSKGPQPSAKPSIKDDKGKKRATIEDEMTMEEESDFDIETAMDAELRQLLDSEDIQSDEALDYNLIKNFLESFKSQGGLSGPVSNLAGRLAPGLKFPRDDLHFRFLTDSELLNTTLRCPTWTIEKTIAQKSFVVNTSGVSRFTKFYTPLHQSAQSIVQKTFSLVSVRPPGLCNFLDAPELEDFLGPKGDTNERWRVVYRSYATLYFVFVVDGAESELGILDLIQVFVESLDRAFENVCELDLVFHFDEVHHILAEIIQGGLVLETNVEEIDQAVQEAARARKDSYTSSNPLSLGGSGITPRGGNMKTPLSWITGKLTGSG